MQKIRKITTISCIKIHTPYILGCSDAWCRWFESNRLHQIVNDLKKTVGFLNKFEIPSFKKVRV